MIPKWNRLKSYHCVSNNWSLVKVYSINSRQTFHLIMITRGRNLRKIEWKNILSSIVQMLLVRSNLKIMAEQIVENFPLVVCRSNLLWLSRNLVLDLLFSKENHRGRILESNSDYQRLNRNWLLWEGPHVLGLICILSFFDHF